MKNGFYFKGKHTDDFGITVKTQNRPIVPSMKTKTYSTAYMDGVYNFSSANSYGREMYNNRTFTVVMQIHGDCLSDLQRQIAKIAVWLCGNGELIFDDTPSVKWSACCETEVSFAPELRGKKALLSVTFNISPFGELTWGTLNGPKLDDLIMLDTKIPLSSEERFSFKIIVPSGISAQWHTVKIPNYGDRPFMPVITITSEDTAENVRIDGLDKSVKLRQNENLITVSQFKGTSGTYDSLAIDFQKQEAALKAWDGYPIITGEFFELSGDYPEIELYLPVINSTSKEAVFTITVDFAPKVVWDVNSDFDWSGADA